MAGVQYNFDDLVNIIQSAPLNKEIKLISINPFGTLVFIKRKKFILFWWRLNYEKVLYKFTIGKYDPKLSNRTTHKTDCGTISIMGAIREAEQMATKHQRHINNGGYPAFHEEQKKQDEQNKQKKQDEQDKQKKQDKQDENKQAINDAQKPVVYSIASLTEVYIKSLKKKKDQNSLRNAIVKNIVPYSTHIIYKPIETVTQSEVMTMLKHGYRPEAQTMIEKIRTAYLAMFRRAYNAKNNILGDDEFKPYNIPHELTALPGLGIPKAPPDKNPLSEYEMWRYYKIINEKPEKDNNSEKLKRLYLKLHLFLGGQRMAQLVRLKYSDINKQGRYLTLYDKKGRGGLSNKVIKLPILKHLEVILDEIKEIQSTFGGSEYVFTIYGKKEEHLRAEQLSTWAKGLVAGKIEKFQLKRVRSGVETLLASMNVTEELRGRLQSHGIAGNVQNKHYNAYGYSKEFKIILMAVYGHVTEKIFISVEHRDDYAQAIDDIMTKISNVGLSDKEESLAKTALRMFRLDTAVSSTGIAGSFALQHAA